MPRILPLAILVLFFGCSGREDEAGYRKQSGDLGSYILTQSAKFGARVLSTNSLTPLTAEWRYKEDADGFQIYIDGNRFSDLHSFLITAFGPPSRPPKTNELFPGAVSVGTRYGPELGAVLNYGWETTRDGKQFTSMSVVRNEALKKALGLRP